MTRFGLSRRATRFAVALVVAAVAAGGALAYLTSSGSGSASASVGTLTAATISTPATTNSFPVITWTSQAGLSDPSESSNIAYALQRRTGADSFATITTGGCAAPLPYNTTTCTDDSLPASGDYDYRVVARLGTAWSATSSPISTSANLVGAASFSATPSDPSAATTPSFAFSAANATGYRCKLDAGPSTSCSSPYTTAALADGPHTLTVHGTNGAASGTDATFGWNVSAVAPSIPTKPSDPSAATAPSFAFAHADYSSFVCELDGSGSFTAAQCSPSGLVDATHTLKARGKAADGSTTEAATYTWTVRSAAPGFASKPASTSANTAPSFAFSTAGAFSSYQCRLDAPAGVFTAAACSVSGLADGSHTLEVRAVAADASTTAVGSYSWTVNTVAPTLGARPASTSARTAPSIAFSHGVYTSFECKLDAASFSACATPQAYSGLSDGSHTFTVHAKDADGVATSDQIYTWTVSTVAPSISVVTTGGAMTSGGTYATTSVTATFGHPIYTNFQCFLDTGSVATCASSKTFSGLADGQHTITAAGVDADGAATATGAFSWFVKTAAPSLTPTPATSPTNSQAISFAFSESQYTSFECSLDGAAFAACTSSKAYSGLSAAGQTGTAHTFDVRAADALGNPTAAAHYAWTIDTTAPGTSVSSVSKTTVGPADTSFTVAWSANESGTYALKVGGTSCADATLVTGTNVSGSYATPSTVTSTVNASALAEGSNTLRVCVADAAGNTGSDTRTITKDTVAPGAPTSVALANGGGTGSSWIDIANVSSVSVSVAVAENLAGDSVTVTISDGTHQVTRSAAVTGPTVTVTGIDASTLTDGTNNISISATETDGAGNVSSPKPATTTYGKDVVAPTAPSGSNGKYTYSDKTSPTQDTLAGKNGTIDSGDVLVAVATAGPNSGTTYLSGAAAADGSVAAFNVGNSTVSVSFQLLAEDPAGNRSTGVTMSFADTK